jgi:methyl-accepting chemotaxis protein
MLESDRRLARAQLLSLCLLGVTLLLAVLCWAFIAQRVLHPLREAGRHFQRIAGGDLSVPVQGQGNNEIGQLFHELQRMQQSQRDTLGQINHCARQLDAAATALNAVTEKAPTTCASRAGAGAGRYRRDRNDHGRGGGCAQRHHHLANHQ